ncbi:MAG: hypothetical protein ABIQ18_47735 [Umezawaea sp.]
MGQVNTTSNLFERIKGIERRVNEVYKKVGLASATITKGGLTLLQDAFLRMVDDSGTEVLYFGPDGLGRQVMTIRREGGAPVMFTYFAGPGQQYWALNDGAQNQLIADDAVSGQGLARPSMVWPVRNVRFDTLPSTDSGSFDTVQDTGFGYKLQPKVTAQIIHCATTSGTTGEAQLLLDGVPVGSPISVAFVVGFVNVAAFAVPGSFMSQHRFELQCRRTGGTGRIGASVIIRGEQS